MGPRPPPERGASLLESIDYLGDAANVIVGAIARLGSAWSRAKSSRLAAELTAIQSGRKMRSLGQVQTSGDGVRK
ncbi:hypothetical protein AAHH80_33665, partial [Burkholderia pseudomallei]